MKKETSRKKNIAKASGQTRHSTTKNTVVKSVGTGRLVASRATSATARSINTANYAKVMSYIVRAEEDETRMMIAASDSMVSH